MSFSVGCDVSKRTLDLAVMRETREIKETFRVSNDSSGYAEILRRLKPLGSDLRVILEATSHYHLELALTLSEAGTEVIVLNPLIMKKFASSGIRKTKTDRVDAKLLAKIGFLEPRLKVFHETRASIEQKLLSQMIGSLKKKRRECSQRLHQIEETRFVSGVAGAACISSLQAIMKTADVEIEDLERRLLDLVGNKARLISTIPGIGLGSAARIVAELGDVMRFRDRDQVTAFAGLDPSIHESGSSIHGRSRITKRGSPELRSVLGQVAWGAMMHNAHFKSYADKKKAEGKHYFTILVATAKKLLLIIYAMLRNGTPYNPALHSQIGLTAV